MDFSLPNQQITQSPPNQQITQNQPHPIPTHHSQVMEEENQESKNFTEREIEIIRSYIGDLEIDKDKKDSEVSKLVERIVRQNELETKSAREIREMIYKLLYQQSSSSSQKLQSKPQLSNQQHNEQQQQQQINQSLSQSLRAPQMEGDEKKGPQQDENIFQPKSLFKSFNQTVENKGFKHSQNFQLTDNNFPTLRKINLFTKPTEAAKSSSNGFTCLTDNKLPEKQQTQGQNFDNAEIPSFSKKNTNQQRENTQFGQYQSKRKIPPREAVLIDPSYSPQQKIEWVESNTHDCHIILEKKLSKKTPSSGKQSYYLNQKFLNIYNEYFYSNFDRAFFNQQNQMTKLFNYLGFDAKKITFKDFKQIKSLLPKPKLFTVEFFISQQNRLNQFRMLMRQAPKERFRSQDNELVVGRQVTALHPICGHLHMGTILAIYKQNQYMIKFSRPQLGTQKVLDINISTRSMSGTNKATIQNLDYESMVIVIKLLQYKGDLLQKFKEYNNLIEELKEENKEPDNQLLQEYGWIGSTINILSMGLRHIIAKFRIRGLNQSNQELVGRNFSSLLINPLNLMSKQLQSSSEQSDVETSNQIKKMAANRSNSRIEEYLKYLSLKNSHYIEDSPLNPEQKENISFLLRNFLGMLLNFRYEGRNFDIQSNRYLDNIQKLIDLEYTEQFNQIYANVHSIAKKIGESE